MMPARWTVVPALLLAAAFLSPLYALQATQQGTRVIPAGEAFTCTPIAVWDGDGPVWCAEGPKIRLSGVAAREIDGSCSDGHPCPAASAIEARDELVGLLGGPKGVLRSGHIKVSAPALSCISKGNGRGSRTAAFCKTSTGVDLSCEMVSSGKAARWQRYWGDHTCH
jgi:endonuclease YncB( thermonuclease family)